MTASAIVVPPNNRMVSVTACSDLLSLVLLNNFQSSHALSSCPRNGCDRYCMCQNVKDRHSITIINLPPNRTSIPDYPSYRGIGLNSQDLGNWPHPGNYRPTLFDGVSCMRILDCRPNHGNNCCPPVHQTCDPLCPNSFAIRHFESERHL